jgi:glycine cleavage system T protein (aminomethyltransferase)
MASPRQSALTTRHKKLGATLGPCFEMDVPWEYDQDVNLEHYAVRNAAGLFDVSGLRKIHVVGPDAVAVIDHMITRDYTQIEPGRSVYAIILNEEGRVTDDCICFHIAPNHVLLVHGDGTGREQLDKSAEGKDVTILFDDDLHDISLQGPMAVEFLDQHTPYDLPSLKYFHQVPTTLFGHNCMISRTGYSGERGYEIFAKADDIGPIWDEILAQGKSEGIIHCSFNCIDMIRVEAALLFYPFDMGEENTPWELGLGFAVSKNKQGDFRGKDAVLASENELKIRTYGIEVDADEAVDADAEVIHNGTVVGKVTAPLYSQMSRRSLAMVQIDPALATPGNAVEVKGENGNWSATTSPIPFLDPDKGKRSGS